MFLNFLFKPFDFSDPDARFYTNLLSGEKRAGKSSFLVKYLYLMLTDKESLPPFKTIFINIDGFDFKRFNDFAESNGLDITFKWLDMTDFKKFTYRERELYTQYNSDGQGYIAKRISENIGDEYQKYISSMIVCDEADHYLTKKDDEFANFFKFTGHYNIEIWFITQKFQNLHETFYNSGAINRFLRVRSPLFNLGNTRILQLWANSNTAKSENMVAQYSYEIDSFLYELYDSGAILKTGDQAKKKLKFYFVLFLLSLVFAGTVFYYLLGDYVSSDDSVDTQQNPITVSNNLDKQPVKDEQRIDNVVKCITFQPKTNSHKNLNSDRSATSNCYFEDRFISVPNDFILGLITEKVSNIKVIYAHKEVSFLSVDDRGLDFIFGKLNKGDKNEKN